MNVITGRENEGDTPKISQVILRGTDKLWCSECGDWVRLEDLIRRSSEEEGNLENTIVYVTCSDCGTDLMTE